MKKSLKKPMKKSFDEAVQRRDIYNLMFDSSPIRGRNWFQIQSVRVPGDVLLQGGSAILALKRSGQQMKAALEDPEAVGPALAAQLEESQSLASFVGTTMHTHVLPPTVLAQKKTKLQHKATNLVHALRLECSNWNVVRKILCELVPFTTTDGGVEKQLRKLDFDSGQVFRWWSPLREALDLDVDALLPDGRAESDETAHVHLNMSRTVALKGTWHWLDLVLCHLLDALLFYDKKFFTSLCGYFNHPPSRQEFRQEADPPLAELEELFKGGPPKIDSTGRDWKAWTEALDWLLPDRLDVIVACWPWKHNNQTVEDDLGNFLFAELADEPADFHSKEMSKHRQVISLHLGKSFSYCYIQFLGIIADWIRKIEAWFCTCRCHPPEVLKLLPKSSKCPQSGCRNIELATGVFSGFLSEVADMSHGVLSARIRRMAQSDDRAKIMAEFGRAKAVLFLEAGLRIEAYARNPLRALGIGSEVNETALQCSADVILQYEVLTPAQKLNSHPRILELCTPPGVDELVRAMQIGSFDEDEGVVATWRAECQYSSSNEQAIEGRHSYTRGYLAKAPNHSEAYVALRNRKHELQKKIDNKLEVNQVVQALGETGSGAACLTALGMERHPRCAPALTPKGICSKFSEGAATRIIYANDSITQWQDLVASSDNNGDDPPPSMPADGGAGGGGGGGAGGGGAGGGGGGKDDDAKSDSDSSSASDEGGGGGAGGGADKDSVFEVAANQHQFEHFRKYSTRNVFYSCKLSSRQKLFPELRPYQHQLEPSKHKTAEDWMLQLDEGALQKRHVQLALQWIGGCTTDAEADIVVPAIGGDELQGVFAAQHAKMTGTRTVFFLIVHRHVKAVEIQESNDGDLAYGPWDMAIEVRPVIAADIKNKIVLLANEGELKIVNMKELLSKTRLLMVWDSVPSSSTYCDDFLKLGKNLMGTYAMGQVYGQLYDTWLKFNNPWTPRFRAKDVTDFHAGAVQELKALDALQKLELAKKMWSTDEFSGWALTQKGADDVQPAVSAVGGKKVTSVAGESEEVLRMTVIDCLVMLDGAKWVAKDASELKSKSKAPKELQTDGSAKPQFYYLKTAKDTPQNLWYLRCLAKATRSELKEPVPHNASVSAYKGMLGIEEQKRTKIGKSESVSKRNGKRDSSSSEVKLKSSLQANM